MTVAWSAIEQEIYNWISTSSGATVIWANQNAERPEKPYIAIRADIAPIGHDALVVRDHPSPSPGAEIQFRSLGMRELRVFMQCFADEHRGAASPHAILHSVHSAAFLPQQREAFRSAGWAPSTYSRVQSISGVLGSSVLEPRALFDVAGFVASEATEDGTYIQIVEGANNLSGENYSWDSEA